MTSLTHVLRQYECAFRDLITFKNLSTDQNVQKALRLNKRADWDVICTALDVIGDTTLAINNFLEFGLEGYTDRDDFGEIYLRLYGVLNATYLQQFAILSLYKRFNLDKLKEVIDSLKNPKVFELRNKLGAHSTNYKNKEDLPESYVINRLSAKGFRLEYKNNKSLEPEWIDLKQCIKEHLVLIIDLLDKIYEKSIKTLYKGEEANIQKQMQILSELRNLN